MLQGFDTSVYVWTWQNGILGPVIFGLIFTTIEFIGWNFFHKKRDESGKS